MSAEHDLVKRKQRFDGLCRNVFSNHEGRELMDMLKRIYVDVPLMQGDDRSTVYVVAQHDLILEIQSHVIPAEEEPIDAND